MVHRIEREPKGILTPEMDLVFAGYAGAEGARILSCLREAVLKERFAPGYVKKLQEADDLRIEEKSQPWKILGASEWEKTGLGGIHTALWNLVGAYHLGFEVDLHRIPILQKTVEVCEVFDRNPYRLYTENGLVLAAENGGRLVQKLEQLKIPAKVIGMVRSGEKKEIFYGEVRGYLEKPREDEIFGILSQEEWMEYCRRLEK